MKIIFYIIFLFYFSNFIYSQTYINEINFIDDEFIELYSDTFLNLSSNKIYDETGPSKFNTLSLNKIENNSNFYLIVGTNFASNNDLSNLNCTIFIADKSQTSNGGLKSSGENFTIELSNSTNLSWSKNQDFSFQTGETLNYNSTNNSYFISKNSPCLSKSNEINSIISNQSCNYSFNILTKKEVFEDKIEYEFETNASDFEIDYWIEDYEKNIILSKKTTSNMNKKSYSPKDFSQIYRIKSQLKVNNCVLDTLKYVFFYSKSQEKIEEIISSEKKSSIKITNEDSLLNLKTNDLRYEIYRGETLKRTTYFYLNSKIVHTLELDKFSSGKGKIELNLLPGENNLVIKGLDEEEIMVIFNIKLIKNNSIFASNLSKKQYFNISNFISNSSIISFKIDSNIQNLTSNCYVNFVKTRVSNASNLSDTIKIFVNDSLLFDKSKNQTNELKLTCKYKKSQLKKYNYYSKNFNYTIEFENKNANIDSVDDYYSSKNLISNDTYSQKTLAQSKKIDYSTPSKLNETIESNSKIYESSNVQSKINSIYFILLGVVLLLGVLLIKW